MPTDRSDDMTPPAHSIEELLQHDAWLRRLIAALVGADRADDVVQQTWMAAMTDPPRGSPRAWLAAVARRLAFRRRRDDARRARREAAVARADEVPSTTATLEKLAAQRAVTEAVHGLAEPYRTAVLLRHHHALGYGDVALRLRCSEAAARQRVKRGLDDVRAALRRSMGPDWRAAPGLLLWLGPTAPLVPDGPVGEPSTGSVPVATSAASRLFGVFVVTKTLTVSASLAVAAAATFFLWPRDAALPPAVTTSRDGGTVAAATADVVDASDAIDRTLATPSAAIPAPPLPAEERARLRTWRGRVIDPTGRALAGVWVITTKDVATAIAAATPVGSDPVHVPSDVRAQPAERTGERLAQTDALGRFEVRLPAVETQLDVDAPFIGIQLHTIDWNDEPREPITLVAARAVDVTGTVVALPANGAAGSRPRDLLADAVPLAGVEVGVVEHDLLELDVPVDRTQRARFRGARTDEHGRFVVRGVPTQAYSLSFERSGYDGKSAPVPGPDDGPLRIWMAPAREASVVLVGTLLDAGGGLVTDGTVGCEDRFVKTGADGSYRLAIHERDAADARLWAAAPERQALVLDDALALSIEQPDGTRLLDLVLPGEALAIHGRVLGPDGQPWPDVLVYPWQLDEPSWRGPVEEFCVPQDREGHRMLNGKRLYATTAADGTFRLGGLRRTGYRLRALHTGTHAATLVDDVFGGSEGIEIRFPANAVLAEVRGVLRDPSGQPVAGAGISIMVPNWKSSRGSSAQPAVSTTSDEDGRFVLEDVPTGDAELVAEDPDHVRTEVPIDAAVPFAGVPLDVVVTIPRRCHLKLDVQDSCPEARRFEVHDADGRKLDLFAMTGTGASWTTGRTLDEGRSEVLQVSEFGVTLVLLDGDGSEVRRVPLQLRPGEVTRVH